MTPLNEYVGYEETAGATKQALTERRTVKQVLVERGYVEEGKPAAEQLDDALDVVAMTHPSRNAEGPGGDRRALRC